MIAHQYKIRTEKSKIEKLDFNPELLSLSNTEIRLIPKPLAKDIIVEYEWLGTIPHQTSYHFGIYFKIDNTEYLGGVLIFSEDYAQNTGVWEKYGFGDKLLLLSRGVCLWWTPKNTASYFISRACKWIKNNTKYRIITATVDPMAGEIGTIYQSLNWHYVGLMTGNYSNSKETKRFSVLINGKLRYSRSIRKEFGCMRKEVILEKYPDAIFINQYRKRRYFYFIDNKINNKKYLLNIQHLLMPYAKRNVNIAGVIYRITNTVNNKVYIGQTVRSFDERIDDYKLGRGNDHLNNAFKKYGFDKFKFEVIDTASTIDELNQKEIYYIESYNSRNKNIGYNIEVGGRNCLASQETREKMSKAHKGRVFSQETIDKRTAKKGSIEALKYGRPKTEEQKKYLSENSPKYWEGKKRDPEMVKRMAETKKAKGITENQIEAYCQCVYCKNIETNVVSKYYSISEAMRDSGLTFRRIKGECLKNGLYKFKTTQVEHLWSFNELT